MDPERGVRDVKARKFGRSKRYQKVKLKFRQGLECRECQVKVGSMRSEGRTHGASGTVAEWDERS